MPAIHLIRHGQASFGQRNYDALSERGFAQSRVLGASLRAMLPRAFATTCGTLQRHRQTATACLEAMGHAAQWQDDAGWNEFDHDPVIAALNPEYADADRLRSDMLAATDPRRAFQALFERAVARWAGGAHDEDYAEPWPVFRARCHAALQRLVATLPASTDAIVFTSGGPICAITQELLRIPDSEGFKLNWTHVNCGVTKLISGRQGVSLSTFNGYAHFAGAHAELVTYR
ncbi:MAG: histidine phosphatase family protein [Rudaea sp.]